ncbi:MAG: hypothetical protein II825_02510 [Paludibacteraceae bacterium]|nr:hypothetical protein [Paludibacteraceae bacterium]
MNKRFLYLIAAIIWGFPGIMITIKGIRAYTTMPNNEIWWLLLITAGVLAGFIIMFRRIVDRYCALIDTEPEKTTILHTFPLRGWILIVCMMSLGIALKFIPWIPAEFTASFYSGLGPALVIASVRFCKKFF